MKRFRPLSQRRPQVGDNWLILVDSPYWPAGTVLQFVMRDWYYGHDPIAEFEEGCKRDSCTILHRERRDTYMDDAEVQKFHPYHRRAAQ